MNIDVVLALWWAVAFGASLVVGLVAASRSAVPRQGSRAVIGAAVVAAPTFLLGQLQLGPMAQRGELPLPPTAVIAAVTVAAVSVAMLTAVWLGALLQQSEVDRARACRAPRRSSVAPPVPAKGPRFEAPAGALPRARSARPVTDRAEVRSNLLNLVKVLQDGPAGRRQAAARALAIPFAGSRDPEVLDALVVACRRQDLPSAVRAEAYVSARLVAGDDVEQELEIALRHRFPEGVDQEWLDALEAELAAR